METLVAVSVIGPVVGAALAYLGCRCTIKRLRADLRHAEVLLSSTRQDKRLAVGEYRRCENRIHELECQLARRHHRKMPKLPDPLMREAA